MTDFNPNSGSYTRGFDVRRALLMISAAGILAGCGAAHAWETWGQITLYIKVGMTEQQVFSTIGWLPNKVEQKTCGTATPNPWSCRILVYGTYSGGLRITEEEWSGGQWHVNSWAAY